ncbi:MAG: YbaN family protein [Chromatiales bacterium]
MLGVVCLVLGIIGAFLPVMPTTVFILIAAWAFANSSQRLHQALLNHPRTGPAIRAWRQNHCIPKSAKLAAGVSMLISWIIVWFTTDALVSGIVAAVLLLVLAYILTRPSEAGPLPPQEHA